MYDDRLVQDTRENVGAPSNLRKQRRSLERYTSHMALMIDIVDTETSSFEEEVKKHVWVDAMMEEYESTVKNSV